MIAIETGWQAPTNGEIAKTYGEMFQIVTHPAFRIGFLDAQEGRPFDHDKIGERIRDETLASYFKRVGTSIDDLFTRNAVELAQYRYEEGRLAVIMLGLRCKAWGHPDFPPRKLRDYIWERADKTPRVAIPDVPPVPMLRQGGPGPLFGGSA